MTSAGPSPRLARAASRAVAGTPGATGQTLRTAGRSSAPLCSGRPDQVVVIASLVTMAAFPVGADITAPLNGRADGPSSFAAGAQC